MENGRLKIDGKTLQIIIFGASGDLTSTKLIPALYNLFQKGKLPDRFSILGFSRRNWTENDFREFIKEEFTNLKIDLKKWDEFSSNINYLQGDFADVRAYENLAQQIGEFDKSLFNKSNTYNNNQNFSNKIFYLSVPPEFYDQIFENIKLSGLIQECSEKHSKIVIEKPFGRDFESAVELNNKLGSIFQEEQIYRIDHVLGKDTLVDIYSFRKNNIILSELLKGELIDHIQISFLESKDIGTRGSFYEKTGVIRDMIQNHLLQMLAVATMDIGENNISKARNDILESIEEIKPENIVIGQYSHGSKDMKEIKAYRKSDDVNPNSNTPTFFAGKTFLNTDKWKQVPVYFRTGKALMNKFTEITIVFKNSELNENIKPNMISFRIQPQEGVYIVLSKRDLNDEEKLENISLDFCYKYSPKVMIRDAYENLLFQVIKGDRTYFVDVSEVLSGWKFADPINQLIENDKSVELKFYPAGSWGPKESYELLESDGRKWYTEEFQLVCRI